MNDLETPTASLNSNGTSPPKSRTSPWFFFAAASLVILIPTLVWQWPHERDRWALAAALRVREAGNKAEASEKVEEVLKRSPQNLSAYLLRAQWHLDDEEYEKSLADFNHLFELRPNALALYLKRSLVLQKMGRHAEAVADLSEILKRTSVDRPLERASALNAVAYARAVGNLEVAEALKQIREAVKISPDTSAILDTQAFVLYRMGELTEAERVMNRALELFEPEFKEQQDALAKAAKQTTRTGDREATSKAVQRNAAVLYYHRGVIREKLGAVADAKADFDRVQELGFTPGEDLY